MTADRGRSDGLPPMRRDDEGHRLHHGIRARGPDHLSPQVDVRGRKPAALPCLRAGRARGGRGEQGIFLSFRDHGEGESIFIGLAREGFPPK